MSARLAKHIRLILVAARRDCAAQGATCALVTGGRHPKLVLERGGRRLVKPICSTPRSVEAAVNLARHDIRRLLTELASPQPQRDQGRRRLATS